MNEFTDYQTKENVNQLLPDLSRYNIAEYHHIDDFRCMRPLREYFDVFPMENRRSEQFNDELLGQLGRKLSEFFKQNGWEGDGTIECIFIPPCFYSDSDTYCETIFHVKQYNNGTSFLAIPKYLRFEMPMW